MLIDAAPSPTETVPRGQLQPATSSERPFELELRFTETYRASADSPPALREARCLAVLYPEILEPIASGDLLAGRIQPRLVGFSPDEWGSCAFGYYHLPKAAGDALDQHSAGPDLRAAVREMMAFWDEEATAARVRRAYPPRVSRYLPEDDWMNTHGVAFPLYRLTGGNLCYDRLLRRGIPGLREDVLARQACSGADGGDAAFLEGLRLALDVLEGNCRHYEAQALTLAASESGTVRGDELLRLARALGGLRERPPETFLEAAQLMWLYSITGDIRNHGRMDVYLGDYLAADLDEDRLDDAEALRILQSLWRLMADRETRVHNRVIVGGVGRRNESAADRFALLAMEATRTVHEPEPQLSLRFHGGTTAEIWDKALDVLAEGRTFPILYNDDVNVPAVMAAFGVERAEAEQYVPFGCGEYIIEHRSFGTPSGVLNLLKALEVTLRDGVDPMTGGKAGLALGRFEEFRSFEELWQAYAAQVEHFVAVLADQQAIAYRVAGEQAPFLYLSLLYDDCLERGRPLLSGGVRHLGGTLETYGNASVADALTAIKRLVYDLGVVRRDELLQALDADFEGYPLTLRLLREAPKYGNDDAAADQMAVRVHDHVCKVTRRQAERVGLDSYLVVIINNAANTLLGRWTAASADGRRAGRPMSNGNAPSSGNDRKGATAMVNSVLKPSTHVHAGAVQNMKLSRELFVTRRAEVRALLDSYFERGGAQAMITVVSRGDLERAMETPEIYQHVFVRVGGFSARFVDLSSDVQLDILHRTLY